MKCKSVNEFENFYFHDSIIRNIKIENNNMIWKIDGVCISTENSQNNESYDTISDIMTITFKDFEIVSIMMYGCETFDSNNNIVKVSNDRFLTTDSYSEFFYNIAENKYIDVMHGGLENDGSVCFEFFLEANNLYRLIFKCIQIESVWEYTNRKAWYVK